MARTAVGKKSVNGTVPPLGPSLSSASALTGGPRDASPAVREAKPNPDQVRQRAYELYQARSLAGRQGDPAVDWLEAEHQLRGGSGR